MAENRYSRTGRNAGCVRPEMSRGQFLRTAAISAAAIGAAGIGLGNANGGTPPHAGCDITLHGSNYSNPQQAVAAVQDAVDNYNRVCLEGQFDFGDLGDGSGYQFIGNPGQVMITKDVEIIGKGATILGGFFSIICTEQVFLKIKDVVFDGATSTGLAIIKSSGAEIKGCEFYNHKYAFFGPNKRVVPITITTAGLSPGVPSDISGNITIKNCIVNPYTPGQESSLAMGILFQRVAADVLVKGNVVKNNNWASIADDASPGNITIKDNVLEPGSLQEPFIPGGAILIGGFPAPFPIGNRIVKDNQISCTNFLHSGIVFSPFQSRPDAVFEFRDNHISLQGYNPQNPFHLTAAIHLAWNAMNSKWYDNEVSGNMGAVILMEGRHFAYTFGVPPFNSFLGNVTNNYLKETMVVSANAMYGVALMGNVSNNTLFESDFNNLVLYSGGQMVNCDPQSNCTNNNLGGLY